MKSKRMLTFLLAIMFVVSGCFAIPKNVDAADERYVEEINAVRYVQYKEYNSKEYPPLGIEPGRPGGAAEYSGVNDDYGYLFGGWYVKRDGLYTPLQAKGDIRENEEVYAKYVPANVLSVKCQNEAGLSANAEEEASKSVADVLLISAVDSLNYRAIGFELYRITQDGQYYKVTTVGTDGGQETDWTYDYLKIHGQSWSGKDEDPGYVKYTPKEVFGGGAKYFTTWRLSKIASSNYKKIIGVRPYWVTMDGVKVYGLSRYMHVEDGYLNYINVPVNLHNAEDVAAGMLKFKYDTTKYELVSEEAGIECGRMFEELTTMERTTGVIECVANASKAEDRRSNTLYVNFRLKPVSGVSSGINTYDFDVYDECFANYNEEEFDGKEYDVWKIRTGLIKH